MSVGSRRAYVEWARRQEKEGGKRAAWIEYRSVVGLWAAKPDQFSFDSTNVGNNHQLRLSLDAQQRS
jgi:hypothetical protein